MKSKNYYHIKILIAIVMLLLLDQWSKYFAFHYLKDTEGIVVIPNVFQLVYVENYGAAFGILQNKQWIFILSAIVFLGIVISIYLKLPFQKRYKPLRFIIIAIVAGGIGNLIDRLWHGYVIDFFYFSLIDFPVFNVADCYVTISMIILIYLFLFYYKEEELQMRNWRKEDVSF